VSAPDPLAPLRALAAALTEAVAAALRAVRAAVDAMASALRGAVLPSPSADAVDVWAAAVAAMAAQLRTPGPRALRGDPTGDGPLMTPRPAAASGRLGPCVAGRWP